MIYTDGNYAYFVSQGIGAVEWMTMKQRIGTQKTQRVKSKYLPLRRIKDQAIDDLLAYADKHKLERVYEEKANV